MAAPQGATTFMPYSLACAAPSTASRISLPSRSRISVVAGLRYSEHALWRGKRARSTSGPAAPARASSNAAVAPAGPAPTTTTSQRLVTTAPRSVRRHVRAEHGRGRADERRREVHAVVVEPSPTPREPYRLVTHGTAALQPPVAGGTLVRALQRCRPARAGDAPRLPRPTSPAGLRPGRRRRWPAPAARCGAGPGARRAA